MSLDGLAKNEMMKIELTDFRCFIVSKSTVDEVNCTQYVHMEKAQDYSQCLEKVKRENQLFKQIAMG